MKLPKERILIFVFAFLVTIMGANVTQASANVDVAFSFHDALAPYGSWVQVSSYGNCWRPRVSAGFIPYSNGHWEYTSYGPTWVGYEPWAWCAYHYGQWVFTPEFGWVWQPGYSYTPGRVVWATGPDYIGWTPYVAGGGPNVNFWVVVNRDRFGYSNYSNYILRRDVVRNMFDSRVVRVHSGTLDRVEVERITHRPIHVVPVDVRQVSADHRSVKLIVPRGHETTVLQEISHAQQNSQSSAKAVTSKKVTTTQVNRFASSKQHSEVKPATNFKASSSSTNKHVSTHQMEPKKVESKKVEPKKHTEISPKSKQYVPQVSKHTEVSTKSMHPVSQVPNGGQKERFNSKEKPHANVAVDSKHVDSKHVDSKQNGKATKSKQSESHKKSKPPQSH